MSLKTKILTKFRNRPISSDDIREKIYPDLLSLQSNLNYKKYTAILLQSSTNAPVAYVQENTIGPIVWTYGTTGYYNATLAGAFPEVTKTWMSITNGVFDTQTALYWIDTNSLELNTATLAGVNTNNHLTYVSVEIRVYP